MSNRGQPAGLSSVNSTADERSASHAYTDRSKCLPLTIETPPVIFLANNLRKVLFHIIWLTYQSHQFFQIIWFPFFFLYFGIQNPQILFLIIKFLLEFNLSLCFFYLVFRATVLNRIEALIFKFKDFFFPLICQHILLSLLTQMWWEHALISCTCHNALFILNTILKLRGFKI